MGLEVKGEDLAGDMNGVIAQLTLEQHGSMGADPHAVNDLHVNFNSPKS